MAQTSTDVVVVVDHNAAELPGSFHMNTGVEVGAY
jgi:hypothetical protein